MADSAVLGRLDRLPAETRGPKTRLLWVVVFGALTVGVAAWAIAGIYPSVIALWAFVVAAVALTLVLPLPYAFVAPLYAGVLGWLVDMLPLLILAAWTTVVLRWMWSLWRDRRMPRGGRWIWLPVGLLVWTGFGVVPIALSGFEDFKHFLLLAGIQFVASGTLVAVVDLFADVDNRARVVASLALFVTILSAAVFLQWIGVPVESLQDSTARRTVEAAYGLDSFPNSVGMIKYARSVEAGSDELRRALEELGRNTDGLPPYEVFRPRFQAFENSLVVRFGGSARSYAGELAGLDIRLLYDNIGLAPANTVPRLRSFPRNALTYAGVCAALFPMMLWLAWSYEGRRKVLGYLGAVSCLFGSAFSLARGSWVAILIGILYLLVVGVLEKRRKIELVAWFLAAAVVLAGTFFVKYGVDPVTGRAGGGASVATRQNLYGDTLDALKDYHLVTGYGTERPRLETGGVREGAAGGEYVPRAGTHSTYLNYLFRAGVVGVVLIAAVYLLAAFSARAAARLRTGRERLFATLITASIVAAAAHAVILSLYVEPTYTLTVTLLLGLATVAGSNLDASWLPWRSRPATDTRR
ncbi:MAG: O-antigen ligase family protein [Actinomycetota bacterium]